MSFPDSGSLSTREHAAINSALAVSVIIPVYNGSQTIGDTLDSLISQTYPKWESIVVDDGSNDGTAQIVQRYTENESRIRLIVQPHLGQSAARNTGIDASSSDWIMFLDADDWISPGHLERMTGHLVSHPELDAVYCRSARVAPDGTPVIERFVPPEGDLFEVLAKRAAFNLHACIVRKSLVTTVGKFDTTFKKSEDWDFWQRIARTGANFGSVREVLAFYRMRPHSGSLNARQVFIDGLRVLKTGHSHDPRVAAPSPAHYSGLPPEGLQKEVFYFLSWCAGLLIGQRENALDLFNRVSEYQCPDLYPPAIAWCVFESAALAACKTPEQWETMADELLPYAIRFFEALETQSKTAGLAVNATVELKKLIMKHSPIWQPVVNQLEAHIDQIQNEKKKLEKWTAEVETVAEEREKWRIHWQNIAEDREKLRIQWQQKAEENEKWKTHWEQTAREKERRSNELEDKLQRNRSTLTALRKSLWVRLGKKLGLIRIEKQ